MWIDLQNAPPLFCFSKQPYKHLFKADKMPVLQCLEDSTFISLLALYSKVEACTNNGKEKHFNMR